MATSMRKLVLVAFVALGSLVMAAEVSHAYAQPGFLSEVGPAGIPQDHPPGSGELWNPVLIVSIQISMVVGAMLAAGLFTSWLAGQKGYDRRTWLVLGCLFTLLALLAMVGAPARGDRESLE